MTPLFSRDGRANSREQFANLPDLNHELINANHCGRSRRVAKFPVGLTTGRASAEYVVPETRYLCLSADHPDRSGVAAEASR